MKVIFPVFLFSFFTLASASQTEKRVSNVLIAIRTDSVSFRGFIYHISDTAIQIYLQPRTKSQLLENMGRKTFNYYSIKDITVIRKGSIAKGALFGAIIGAVAGFAAKKSNSTGTFAIDLTPLAVVGGASIGTVCGAIFEALFRRKNFLVDGKKEKFKTFQGEISKKLFKENDETD